MFHAKAALQLRLLPGRIVDGLLGRVACDVATECGDFVLRRADGVWTDQLAAVVDDASQGITHVLRGADLILSTPRQIARQRRLDLPTSAYLHLPVAFDSQGRKLSKQTLAEPVDARRPLPALLAALSFLDMPTDRFFGSVAEFWTMAQSHWSSARLPRVRGKGVPALSQRK